VEDFGLVILGIVFPKLLFLLVYDWTALANGVLSPGLGSATFYPVPDVILMNTLDLRGLFQHSSSVPVLELYLRACFWVTPNRLPKIYNLGRCLYSIEEPNFSSRSF